MRRGEAEFTMMTAIVIGVGFLLVAIAVGLVMRDKIDNQLSNSECAIEIVGHHTLAELTREYANIQISCPTRVITAKGSEERVRAKIADEMARCWSQWGEGKYLLFGEEKGRYCHVCALIDTPDVESVSGLPAYLRDTKYVGSQTYAEYLTGVRLGDFFDETAFASHAQDTMQTSNELGVVFYYAKGEDGWNELVRMTGGNPIFMAAAGGLAVGTITVVSGGSALPVITLSMGGATAAGFTSFTLRPDKMSHMSMVVVRPMTPEAIRELNCTRAPVAEK